MASKTKRAPLPPGVEVEKTTKAYQRAERKVTLDGEPIGFIRREAHHGWIAVFADSFYEPDKRWYGQPIYHAEPRGKFGSLQGFDTEAEAVARLAEVAGWDIGNRVGYTSQREKQRSIHAAREVARQIREANDRLRGWYDRITDHGVKSLDLARAMDLVREAAGLAERNAARFKDAPAGP